MDNKIQSLYTQLTQEDRDKVDVKIRELFAEQREQTTVGSSSSASRQEDCG